MRAFSRHLIAAPFCDHPTPSPGRPGGEGWEPAELPGHLSAHRRPPLLERHPELVCARAGVQPDTLLAHLHHNHPEFSGRLEDVVTAAGYISDADLLTADWQVQDRGQGQ